MKKYLIYILLLLFTAPYIAHAVTSGQTPTN